MHAGSIIGSIGIADTTLVGGTTIDRNDQKSDRLAAKLLTIPIAIAPSGANDVRVDRQHSPADVGHRIVLSDMLTCLHRNAELVLPVRITFTIALTLILMSGLAENAAAVVRITDDRGGNIGVYWSRYMALRDAGEQVMIDGTCSSACTLVLGIVRMIESVLRQTRCLVFTPPGVLAFSASRSLMILPHARFGTSIRCQFDSGSAQWRARPRNNLSIRPRAPEYVPTMPLMIIYRSGKRDRLHDPVTLLSDRLVRFGAPG